MNFIEQLEKVWDTWEIMLVIIPIIVWQLFKKQIDALNFIYMSKRKFIIDADTGSDDAVAILMALQDAKQLLIFMTMKKAIRMLELSQNLTMKCF